MGGAIILGLRCLLEAVARPAPAQVPHEPMFGSLHGGLDTDELLGVVELDDTPPALEMSAVSPGSESSRNHRGLVLSVSWQPAHCETRPDEAECVSMTADRFDASHFALHGLWPQPRDNVYCDVDAAIVADDKKRRWHELPEPDLSESTRAELAAVMPAVQIGLHRHAWWKHGTCYDGLPAETYFADSLTVMRALNASAARELFAANVGRELTRERIREEFDRAFGPGAGTRVSVTCVGDGDRRLIVGLRIEFAGTIGAETEVGELIVIAPATDPGCGSGIVDPVGLQ